MAGRLLAVMIMGFTLSACASRPEYEGKAPSQTLILEKTLVGRTTGDGAFVNSITGGETKFSVVIDGTWDGKILTLVEDFTYTDGTKERKTWRLTKSAEGQYRGVREDVIDAADVTQDGTGVRLDYRVTLTTGLGDIDVRFQDLLYLEADGTIANKAVVSKFGLRVGRVHITMRPGTPGS
ncbi:MAG: DUF3833 domain-containing protein [Alphaproteobacteria bacterium]|nr:DUF3833 domain-containing protein [Alphaproteobacteria bacterium]